MKAAHVAFVGLLLLFATTACNRAFPVSASDVQRAEAAYDAKALRTGLEQIATWHDENQTGVNEHLKAGVSAEHVAEAFEGLGYAPTEELIALWCWRDGETGPAPFVWYHDFLSVTEAVAEYRDLLRDPFVLWDERYIPFLIFEGEWYAVYCGEGATTAGPVVHLFLEDEPRIAYTNITTLIATMSEAFRANAVRWDTKVEGMVEDIRHLHGIHQKHNRGCAFPYHVPEAPDRLADRTP